MTSAPDPFSVALAVRGGGTSGGGGVGEAAALCPLSQQRVARGNAAQGPGDVARGATVPWGAVGTVLPVSAAGSAGDTSSSCGAEGQRQDGHSHQRGDPCKSAGHGTLLPVTLSVEIIPRKRSRWALTWPRSLAGRLPPEPSRSHPSISTSVQTIIVERGLWINYYCDPPSCAKKLS